jgi:cell division septum initiation protein DivIVA
MTSNGFENQIKKWLHLDNQIKQFNDKIKELREERSNLEKNITSYAHSNQLSSSIIKIGEDKVKFASSRIPEQLTFRYLEKTLGEIIKNESQVQIIMDYVKQKREIKVVPEIKRFNNN